MSEGHFLAEVRGESCHSQSNSQRGEESPSLTLFCCVLLQMLHRGGRCRTQMKVCQTGFADIRQSLPVSPAIHSRDVRMAPNASPEPAPRGDPRSVAQQFWPPNLSAGQPPTARFTSPKVIVRGGAAISLHGRPMGLGFTGNSCIYSHTFTWIMAGGVCPKPARPSLALSFLIARSKVSQNPSTFGGISILQFWRSPPILQSWRPAPLSPEDPQGPPKALSLGDRAQPLTQSSLFSRHEWLLFCC
jgi:hypothetical protein